jgi:hypothetical protein
LPAAGAGSVEASGWSAVSAGCSVVFEGCCWFGSSGCCWADPACASPRLSARVVDARSHFMPSFLLLGEMRSILKKKNRRVGERFLARGRQSTLFVGGSSIAAGRTPR